MVLQRLAVQHSTEAVGSEREVFTLGEQEEHDGRDFFLQLEGEQTPDARGAPQGAPQGSATGSATGSAIQGLRMPYEKHMEPNKHAWAMMGGWTAAQDRQREQAKKHLDLANKYAGKKEKEKEIAEMGCPCEGEKYHDIVWGGDLSKLAVGSAAGAADFKMGLPKPGSDDAKDQGRSMSEADIKKYVEKYGKLGPQSQWQPKHDKKLKKARRSLKLATKMEDAAFKTAVPEFKKMKAEEPEFFTNGKCPCPESWTLQDAADLAKKVQFDIEEDYSNSYRAHLRETTVDADVQSPPQPPPPPVVSP